MFGKNKVINAKSYENAPADTLNITSIFSSLQGEATFSGRPAVFVRLTGCNLMCPFCFAPSTKILMKDGTKKRIDQIKLNDEVMSWTGEKFEGKPVTKIYKSITDKLVKIDVDSSISKTWCTPEHPILTSNRGYVSAGQLKKGDILVHWKSQDRMRMFNPSFTVTPKMTEEGKQRASINLTNLWKTPKFRKIVVDRMSSDKNPMKNPEIALKSYQTRENQTITGLEKKFIKICDGLPIEFVGDGKSLTAGYKIPDFVVTGQKKLIEIWSADAPWAKKAKRNKKWVEKRRKLFSKYGYETLFIPFVQKDLNKCNHKKIREKVAAFINNGLIVNWVKEIDQKAYVRLYGSKSAEKVVYNLEVEDNHTYVANNIVVHNCDTFFDSGTQMTFNEIFKKVESVTAKFYKDHNLEEPKNAPANKPFLVITGGEPLLQHNLTLFLYEAGMRGYDTQIESNGSVFRELPDSTYLVISPKVNEKIGKFIKVNDELLKRANCLKFVVSKSDEPYTDIPQFALDWYRDTNFKNRQLYVSPMNCYARIPDKAISEENIDERSEVNERISFWTPGLLDLTRNQANHEHAAFLAMKHKCRLTLQSHLYGNLP